MARLIKGKSGAVTVAHKYQGGDRNGVEVTVKGPYQLLKSMNAASFVPANYVAEDTLVSPDGSGMGTLVAKGTQYSDGTEAFSSPTRIIYTIDMVEVVTPLERHPRVAGKNEVALWLATDVKKRRDGDKWTYEDASGTQTEIYDDDVKKFCAAYADGITTYNRYFPVIEKTSYYHAVPGLTMVGAKVTGGTAKFSPDIGQFSSPGIHLVGFADTGWFKSSDKYALEGKHAWRRIEQWTWTPEGSGSQHAWIYGGGTAS